MAELSASSHPQLSNPGSGWKEVISRRWGPQGWKDDMEALKKLVRGDFGGLAHDLRANLHRTSFVVAEALLVVGLAYACDQAAPSALATLIPADGVNPEVVVPDPKEQVLAIWKDYQLSQNINGTVENLPITGVATISPDIPLTDPLYKSMVVTTLEAGNGQAKFDWVVFNRKDGGPADQTLLSWRPTSMNASGQIEANGYRLGASAQRTIGLALDADGNPIQIGRGVYDPSTKRWVSLEYQLPGGTWTVAAIVAFLDADPGLQLAQAAEPNATVTPEPQITLTRAPDGTFTATATVAPTEAGPLEWDKNTKLPDLNTQNTKVETDEDGNTVLVFTLNNNEYSYVIDKPEAIDRAGNAVADGVVDVKLFEPPQSGSVQESFKIVLNQGEDAMAWFDGTTGTWLNRYETLFERDEYQDVAVGIVQDGIGFESIDKKGATDEVVDYFVNFSGRPLRVYSEKVWNDEKKHYSTLYWTSVSYDDAGHFADVLVETDERGFLGKPGVTQLILITQGDKDYAGSSAMPTTIYPISKIMDALRTGSYIQVRITLYDDKIANDAAGTENLFWGSPIDRALYLVNHFEPEVKSLVKAIIGPHLKSDKDLQDLDAYLGPDLPEAMNGARIGHNGFWIFTP